MNTPRDDDPRPDQAVQPPNSDPSTLSASTDKAAEGTPELGSSVGAASTDVAAEHSQARRIKIGSQRYGGRTQPPKVLPPLTPRPVGNAPTAVEASTSLAETSEPQPPSAGAPAVEAPIHGDRTTSERLEKPKRREKPRREGVPQIAFTGERVPVPNIRAGLPPELEEEVEAALGGMSLEDALTPDGATTPLAPLEPDSTHGARVVAVHRDDVFVDLGGRNQGVLSLQQFDEPPAEGDTFDVVVVQFNPDEGLYQVRRPTAAIAAADWGNLAEGVVVEARVTGHNSGGLECEVNNILGFIPASQIAPYRVENFEEFVDQRFACVVTEANSRRNNLVLSRRAVLEREKAAARERLLAELAPGDIREGVVRSIQDFGAFVDLGGVDGLLHISQLAWQRVKHPSEVLEVGQKVRVSVSKIDPNTGKIGLSYRDLLENPWTDVESKYPVATAHRGKVTRLMEFGAFVQLEPGVEGLVHISELAHKRVLRPSDVVAEGQEVDVKVLSVDGAQQRISLSVKALLARAEPVKEAEPLVEDEPAAPIKPTKRRSPLKGGIERGGGGERFGLKW